MVVKSVTMADMKKSGTLPKSPTKNHQDRIGKGTYNRFNLLQDPKNRTQSEGKRGRGPSDEVFEVESGPKIPRLDEDLVVSQLAKAEHELKSAKHAMDECKKVAEECFSAKDGQMGTAFYYLTEAVSHLITNQEWLTSVAVDSRKLANQAIIEQDKVCAKVNKVVNNVMSFAGAAKAGGTGSGQVRVAKPPPH